MEYTYEIIYPHELATAHVLIKCKSGYEKRVIENLEKIQSVKCIHRTFGVFDILAKIEATDYESLRKVIRWKINNDNIESITPLICARKSLCAAGE